MLREHLQELADLVLVGSVGLAVIGAFLLIVATNRLCLVAKALRTPVAVQQTAQDPYGR